MSIVFVKIYVCVDVWMYGSLIAYISFGLILDEFMVGRIIFQKSRGAKAVGMAFILSEWELDIPLSVLSTMKELICDCLAMEY
jgi:hypothetical protein